VAAVQRVEGADQLLDEGPNPRAPQQRRADVDGDAQVRVHPGAYRNTVGGSGRDRAPLFHLLKSAVA